MLFEIQLNKQAPFLLELGEFGDNFPSSLLDDLLNKEKTVFLPARIVCQEIDRLTTPD